MAKLSFPSGLNVAEKRAAEQAKLKQMKKAGAAPNVGKLK